MKTKILSSLLCSVIMLNSYSVLADEVVIKPFESTTTTDVVIQTNDISTQKSDIVVILDKDVDVLVDENGSQSIRVSVTPEQSKSTISSTTNTISENSSTMVPSTENVVENMKDNSKSTTIVNNDGYVDKYDYNYVSPTFYENNDQNNQSSESEPTTGQMIPTSITDVSKKDDVLLETSKEPVVGTLTPLGVTDESKPVGLLEYLHKLPNTSSGAMKLSVLLGTFVISGLIIGLLYKFSRKIFE
mgnify:CR=1 FL=1